VGTVGRVPGRIGRGLVPELYSCCVAVDDGDLVDFVSGWMVRLRKLCPLDLMMMAFV
jgi:hypothetical protein